MKKIIGQILSGTNLDLQGERLSKEFLEKLCEKLSGRVIPLHTLHDMAREASGFIENFRLTPHYDLAGEWCLIGDVTIERGNIDEAMKGFSISFLDSIREDGGYGVSVYVPFPFYNDSKFLDEFLGEEGLGVGRWVKKSAEETGSALFITSLVVFFATPMWDSFYKSHIAPSVNKFISKYANVLSENGLSIEHVQVVDYEEREVEVRFLPPRGREKVFLSSKAIQRGLTRAKECLEKNKNDGNNNITRIVMEYDFFDRCYKVSRYESSIDW